MSSRIARLAVIGVGLIGGSLAKAARTEGFAAHTCGYSLNHSEAKLGVELGVIDEAAESIAAAVKGADLVVLAVPVKAF
ncbi:prephenate dehydrogenase/arogenate dehydrogenase family protein, partial [Oleiphilus sp. HI0123]